MRRRWCELPYADGDIALHFGMPEQRLNVVNFDVCKKPPN